jgi:esterase/lipase
MNFLENFNKFRLYLKNKGILETDLPFLLFNENNKKSILVIHGSEASPCNTVELSQILYSKGYNVLSLLLEGHGEDKENLHSGKVTWNDCYNSAKKYLKFLQNFSDDIYILGSSFGGSLAYLLSIEFKNQISGIIAISSPSYSKKDFSYVNQWIKQVYLTIKEVEKNISNVSLPCLILHSEDDLVVKLDQALFAFNNISSSYKKLIIYNKVGHSLGFAFNNNEVANDIDNFIKNNLLEKNVTFRLKDNNYNKVSVAGDFNNWLSKDLEMKLDNNEWTLNILLKPGKYQYKFIINDNIWILDPKAESIFAPNGNKNSLLIVN